MNKILIVGILIVLLIGVIFYIYSTQQANDVNYGNNYNSNYGGYNPNYNNNYNPNYGGYSPPTADSTSYDDVSNIDNSTNYDASKDNEPQDSIDSSYSNNTNNTSSNTNTNTSDTNTSNTYSPSPEPEPYVPKKVRYSVIYRSTPNWAYGIVPYSNSIDTNFSRSFNFWAFDITNMKQSPDYFNVYKSVRKTASDGSIVYYTSHLGEMKGINTSSLTSELSLYQTAAIFGVKTGEMIERCVREYPTPYRRQAIVPYTKCEKDGWKLLFRF